MKVLQRSIMALVISAVVVCASQAARAADLVDTISGNPDFKVFTLVLKAAGLIDLLKSKGPFTVFAPSDDAFGKLPAGMVESLLQPKNIKTLRAIVKYHMLGGKTLMASRIIEVGNFDIDTLEGSTAEIDIKTGPSIENARIIQADINAKNGVIHMINAVMLPPAVKKRIGRGG